MGSAYLPQRPAANRVNVSMPPGPKADVLVCLTKPEDNLREGGYQHYRKNEREERGKCLDRYP